MFTQILSLGSDIEITMIQDYTHVSMSFKIQTLTLPVSGWCWGEYLSINAGGMGMVLGG